MSQASRDSGVLLFPGQSVNLLPSSCLLSLSAAIPSGDLAFNVALGATLVALPLTIGAAARSAFVKYKFTDKRVSVKTDAPWESEWHRQRAW